MVSTRFESINELIIDAHTRIVPFALVVSVVVRPDPQSFLR